MHDSKSTTHEVKAAEVDTSKGPIKAIEPADNKVSTPAVAPSVAKPETQKV